MNTQKDIPAIIKAARIRAGLTQQELALKCGYDADKDNSVMVRQWESGRRPVPDDRKRALVTALDLTFDDIIP